MIEKYTQRIEICTKTSTKQRRILVNWFNKQNILIQINIFKEQKNQFFKLKKTNAEENTITLSAFFIAIDIFYKKEQLQKNKNKSQNLETISSISNFSINKFRKQRYKHKKEKLMNMWSVVQKLKNENFSFRDISKYIRQKHRFEVSHTYIMKIWKELEYAN